MKKTTHLVEGVDLNCGLGHTGERPLGTLTSGPQTPERTGILRDVELGLALELLLEVLKQVVVEVLTTQVGITGGSLDGEDTTGDIQERDIESSSAQIEDKDVLLRARLTVKTVGDGSSGRLVNDTEDIETSDGTSILGSESLRVVEIGGDTMRPTKSAKLSSQAGKLRT